MWGPEKIDVCVSVRSLVRLQLFWTVFGARKWRYQGGNAQSGPKRLKFEHIRDNLKQCFLFHFFDIYHFSSKSPNLIDIFHFDQICPPQAPKNCIFPFANEISNAFLMISTTFLETFGKFSSKMVYVTGFPESRYTF